MPNNISEDVLYIREPQADGSRHDNYPRGRACQEFLKFFRKKLTVPEIPYLYTLSRTHALLNAITYLKTRIAYLKTLTRLSAPYVITCIAYLNTLSRLSALDSIS